MKQSVKWLSLLLCLGFSGALAFGAEDTTVIESGYESGNDVGGWMPRTSASDKAKGVSSEELGIVSDFAHSGSSSLKISHRSTTWQGPKHVLTDKPVGGDTYRISVWIGYKDGPSASAFNFSIEKSYKDPAAGHTYQNIQTVRVNKGSWTQLQADYIIPNDPLLSQIEIYFELPWKSGDLTEADKIDFYVDDVKVVKINPDNLLKIQDDIPNLLDTFRDFFTVGVALNVDNVDKTSPYFRMITKHYGAIVAGNEMKMDALEPTEGNFKFVDADKIVNFGQNTGMRVRGHTLLWHQQVPAWFFTDPADASKPATKEVLSSRLEKHIKTVVEHYKGQVESWDVVNEVLNEDGTLRDDAHGSKYLSILGPGYIAQAFKWAHEADPDAQLVINDYNLESSKAKRDGMVKLVKDLKKQKVPVDAIGMQMHIKVGSPSVKEIKETIDAFVKLGVKVVITELDVSVYAADSDAQTELTPDVQNALAQRYKELFDLFKVYGKKKKIDTVILWGLSDGTSWLNNHPVIGRNDYPMLFDRKLQAKPAFWALVDPSKLNAAK